MNHDPIKERVQRLQDRHHQRKREAFAWMKDSLPGCDQFLKELKAEGVPFTIELRDGDKVIWS